MRRRRRDPANRDVRSAFKHKAQDSLSQTTQRKPPQMYVHDQALPLVSLARSVGVDAAGLQQGRVATHRRGRKQGAGGTEEGMFAGPLAKASQEHGRRRRHSRGLGVRVVRVRGRECFVCVVLRGWVRFDVVWRARWLGCLAMIETAKQSKENLPAQTPTPTRTTTGQGVRPPGTYDHEEGGPRQDTQRRRGRDQARQVRTHQERWTSLRVGRLTRVTTEGNLIPANCLASHAVVNVCCGAGPSGCDGLGRRAGHNSLARAHAATRADHAPSPTFVPRLGPVPRGGAGVSQGRQCILDQKARRTS